MTRYFRARSSSYQNPYFPKKATQRHWPKIVAYAVAVAVAAMYVLILFSSLLELKGIIITGARPTTTRIVWNEASAYGSEIRLFRPRQSSLALFDLTALSERLSHASFAEKISVRRSWWHRTITIDVKEHTPALVVLAGEQTYLADSRGYIFDEIARELASAITLAPLPAAAATGTSTIALPDLPKDLLAVTSTPQFPLLVLPWSASSTLPSSKNSPLSDDQKNFISSMISLMPDAAGTALAAITLRGGSGAFVDVRTVQGWTLKLNTTRPLEQQLEDMKETLTGLKIDRTRLEYLDVRFSDRVFYKEK